MDSRNIETAANMLAMNMLGVASACRECGAVWSDTVARSFAAGHRCKCVKCGWYGTWRAGTILAGRHIETGLFIVLFSAFSLFRAPSPAELRVVAARMELHVDYVKEWHNIIVTYLTRGGQ